MVRLAPRIGGNVIDAKRYVPWHRLPILVFIGSATGRFCSDSRRIDTRWRLWLRRSRATTSVNPWTCGRRSFLCTDLRTLDPRRVAEFGRLVIQTKRRMRSSSRIMWGYQNALAKALKPLAPVGCHRECCMLPEVAVAEGQQRTPATSLRWWSCEPGARRRKGTDSGVATGFAS